MFNIEEIRFLCDRDLGPFYLSPKSTYEFIIYGDIDHYEILVEVPLDLWLQKLKHIEYKFTKKGVRVYFQEELFEVDVVSIVGFSIEEYLNQYDFNISGVSIKISDDTSLNTFACYQEKYCASWVDPYSLRASIKHGLIKPIHLDNMTNVGHKIFKMFSKMVDYKLDLDKDTIVALKMKEFELNSDVSTYFFNILKYHESSQYIVLLDELGLLDKAYPLIKKMKKQDVWSIGLKSLENLERILNDQDIFSDGVRRNIDHEMSYGFACGLNKYQMIKFSVLFYQAHQVMLLKNNAPEPYEDQYTSFCEYFGFKEEACRYYSMMIKSSKEMTLNLNKKVEIRQQYDFYEEYENYSIDVLLIYLIKHIDKDLSLNVRRFEYMVKKYISKYCELQSINAEVTTLDIQRKELSDVKLTLLIEEVKEKIFFGNLRYDIKTIINYLQKLIEQSN